MIVPLVTSESFLSLQMSSEGVLRFKAVLSPSSIMRLARHILRLRVSHYRIMQQLYLKTRDLGILLTLRMQGSGFVAVVLQRVPFTLSSMSLSYRS